MKYFRNSELVKLYNVSDKAVRNWIEAAQNGKSELELYEDDSKVYIADTLRNGRILEQLVEHGKKYRNRRSHRRIAPSSGFYELYDHKQIIEAIHDIDIYREYPLHHRYLGYGAVHWDKYLHKLYTAGGLNNLTSTFELLRFSRTQLDTLLASYESINIVDVGVGNGLAAKELLGHVLKTGKLKKYIGIDISQALLDITANNIHNWFGGAVQVEKHIRNILSERFGDVLHADSYGEDAAKTINLVLFFGGTIYNFRDPGQALQTIRDSMSKEDILMSALKLDTPQARRFFDFNADSEGMLILSRHAGFLLDLLNIDEAMYEVEQFYGEDKKSRFTRIRFKVAFSLSFEVGAFQKTVEFQKGDTLLLYRGRHFTNQEISKLYEENGLYNLQTVMTEDQQYMMLVSRIKTADGS